MTTLPPCKFCFDDSPTYDGFSHGSTWNGFDNVAVTKETLDKIMADFVRDGMHKDEAEEHFGGIEPMSDGLYSLGWGFSTSIVTDAPDMQIMYLSAEAEPAPMSLNTLLGNFRFTKTTFYEEDIRNNLDGLGWYEGLHDNGPYCILNLAKLNLTYSK